MGGLLCIIMRNNGIMSSSNFTKNDKNVTVVIVRFLGELFSTLMKWNNATKFCSFDNEHMRICWRGEVMTSCEGKVKQDAYCFLSHLPQIRALGWRFKSNRKAKKRNYCSWTSCRRTNINLSNWFAKINRWKVQTIFMIIRIDSLH